LGGISNKRSNKFIYSHFIFSVFSITVHKMKQ
jgi:hypothetical protein